MRIGAAERVIGITYHSVLPPETAGKSRIGSFSRPDIERIAALEPDLIVYSQLQQEVLEAFRGRIPLICLTAGSLQESKDHLLLLGKIFGREEEADRVLKEQQRLLSVIAAKTEHIAAEQKQRVVRLMGSESVMAPGDNSFQNEFVRAAGGIAPEWGREGDIIQLDPGEWEKFNPQVIYGCGKAQDTLQLLDKPGWRDVDAVKNQRYFFYPCDLTCRASTHTGDFVSWLSANIYQQEFSDPARQVLIDAVVNSSLVPIDFEYVKIARIVQSDIRDFRHKSLVIEFDRPLKVVSTLEGERQGIIHIGNHYFPPPSWGLGHEQGVAELRKRTFEVLGLTEESTAFLFTGADMDNVVTVTKSYRDMEVTALVTAGVGGNALRMSADQGLFYEPDSVMPENKPGTINILLLSNMRLSSRAMTRAIISATEAKTAALQDLDIRSAYTGMSAAATGTGTDNILVAEGAGVAIDSSGGHTKMGELIARAVYEGVTGAIYKQNGLTANRSIFQRIQERGIDIRMFNQGLDTGGAGKLSLEHLLLNPVYSSFIEAALAISDAYERGLIQDLSSFDAWCRDIAGRDDSLVLNDFEPATEHLPIVLRKAFVALNCRRDLDK
jgi:adenosylcobinamide amidohydrolase/ABC-type Fe3+-hydroxamate transport system substrate-binding protein